MNIVENTLGCGIFVWKLINFRVLEYQKFEQLIEFITTFVEGWNQCFQIKRDSESLKLIPKLDRSSALKFRFR